MCALYLCVSLYLLWLLPLLVPAAPLSEEEEELEDDLTLQPRYQQKLLQLKKQDSVKYVGPELLLTHSLEFYRKTENPSCLLSAFVKV